MAIPGFQDLMLPLLEFAGDGAEHTMADAREHLARHFSLTEEERAQLLPSGRARTFLNRVAWAKTYLVRAKLLDAPRRGVFCITPRGREVLQNPPSRISISFLDQFPEFVDFRTRGKSSPPRKQEPETPDSPEEQLETAYQQVRDDLASELLEKVKGGTSEFFEHLVVEVLLRMGYGGSRNEAGEAIGRSGDEGIDGVINEDRLGLDVIYIQAKKWDNTVGRPEIQKFVGALHGKRAKKGVFLTTGAFSNEAWRYVSTIEPKVVLIDGDNLAQLMIDFDVGVTSLASYELKRLDLDYFDME